MTQENNQDLPGGGIRRVSHKDRKKQLKSAGSLFPIEDASLPPQPLASLSDVKPAEADEVETTDAEASAEPEVADAPEAADVPEAADNSGHDVATEPPIVEAPPDPPPSVKAPGEEREEAKRLMQDLVKDVVSALPPMPDLTLPTHDEAIDENDETVVAAVDFAAFQPAAREFPAKAPEKPRVDNPARYPLLNPVAPPLEEESPATQPKSKEALQHNLVALGFAIATIAIIGYFVYIWQNPYSALNPLAPPTPFVIITETPDSAALAALASPEITLTPESETPPTTAATTIPIDAGGFPFVLSDSGVIYTPNANGAGCNWASIAGAVTGLQGEPLDNYGVQITDIQDPGQLDVKVFSGSALSVGAGGFELSLGGNPLARTYRVQLFTATGAPVSREFEITTRENCDENVAIINFVQIEGF